MRRQVLGVVLCLVLSGCGDSFLGYATTDLPPFPILQRTGVSDSRGSSHLTISGKAFYEDKPYDKNGFTGTRVEIPIRHAVVNLISNDTLLPVASSQTGEDGSFSFNNINNSSRFGGVYIQIQAKNANDSTGPSAVLKSNGDLLFVIGGTLDDSQSDNFISQKIIADADNIGGAFNILDVILKGGAFIRKPGFCPTPTMPTEGCQAPFVTVYWEPSNSNDSFFINGSISIKGGGPTKYDTDEYDDWIILHEYGHFIANRFSQDESPGGAHRLSDTDQDLRLSWSEGWASFFASAVLNDPASVDTTANGASSFNIESATRYAYITNEVSVSALLWDIFDAPSPDDDPITTAGFLPVWKSFKNMPTATTTMERFAFLFMDDNPGSVSDLQTILQGRRIELFPDVGEIGELPLSANGASQHHTLYQSGDEDIIPFNVTSGTTYTIKTFNLTNGADTFLAILGLTNDNTIPCNPCRNGLTTLASSITFTANTSDMFVLVKRSPNAPPSAGLTGSYDIKLTRP